MYQTLLKTLLLASSTLTLSSTVFASDWTDIEKSAQGQTVYFNAWGGSENINNYISWAAEQVEKKYQVSVKQVKITDAAEVVSRIQTEKDAGRSEDGSVDLIWVNGENFSRLKQNGLLFGPWAEQLPNWQYVDTNKPVQQDFSETTDGLEAPWGTAQLTFIANKATLDKAPNSAQALLKLAEAQPGRITYPKPPAFHGTTFLKQLLLELSDKPEELQKPVADSDFNQVSAPLWAYLDQLHPHTWRKGEAFPASVADMHQKLADGELLVSMTFNPNEGANLVASGQLPETTYSFGFDKGTIGNVHFVAIPFNAKAKEGAQVFANFLLSPEAQSQKANVDIWGDPSVLAIDKLNKEQQAAMNSKATGALNEPVPTLQEPHASWVEALEKEWLKRYGG